MKRARKRKASAAVAPETPVIPVARAPRVSPAHLAELGVYLFAYAWPLGAYQRVLGPLHLHHIALMPMLLCLVLDLKKNKRLRVPVELCWPAAAIAILAVMLRLTGYAALPWRYAGLCAVFVIVAHVVRNRRMALRALQLSLIGAWAMVGISVLARRNLVFPTAWSLDSGLVMAGPYTVRDGVCAALFCLLLTPALIAAARRREYAPCWCGIAAWACLPVLLALFFWLRPRVDLLALRPWHGIFLSAPAVLAALFLWLVARITAKLWVARRFMAPGVYLWLGAALLAGTLLTLYLTPLPTAGFAFLLAVIAGYAQPYLTPERGSRAVWPLAALTAAVVLLNMAFILPGDPRDYERVARNALAQNELRPLRDHLAFVRKRAPGETRADYYMARAYLAEDRLQSAATSFVSSLRGGRTRVLPHPDETLVDAFLNEMRDRSSAHPERIRGLAYEQSLIAAGRERHALSLLDLRGDASSHPTLMPIQPLAAAVATALDAPHLVDELQTRDHSLLTAILESAGPLNEVAHAPEGFPEGALPLVVMARPGQERDEVFVFSPSGQVGGIRAYRANSPVVQDFALFASDPGWRDWRVNAEGVWTLAFGMSAEIQLRNTPVILFRPYQSEPEPHLENQWEIKVFLPAEASDE